MAKVQTWSEKQEKVKEFMMFVQSDHQSGLVSSDPNILPGLFF